MKHYIAMWTNILNFSGRTTRAGYWVPYLINILVFALIGALLPAFVTVLGFLADLAMFSMLMRRIRDAGFPPILALLTFADLLPIPLVGLLGIVPTILALFPTKN